MNTFKVWLEEQGSSEARRKHYFDQVMQILQATDDDLSRPLDQLPAIKTPKPADGESQPPQHNQGALTKVRQLLGNVLQQMSSDKLDTEISVRAKRTMDVLNRRSNDGKIRPDLYLQDLLRELFGNDFHEELLDNQTNQDDTPMPTPDDNAMVSQNQGQEMDLNDPTNQEMPQPDQMQMQMPGELPTPQKKPFGGPNFV